MIPSFFQFIFVEKRLKTPAGKGIDHFSFGKVEVKIGLFKIKRAVVVYHIDAQGRVLHPKCGVPKSGVQCIPRSASDHAYFCIFRKCRGLGKKEIP